MPDLAAVLARAAEVQWFAATVTAVNAGSIEVAYADGRIPNVGFLDQYIPAVGDTVHVLSWGPMGCLALGSNNFTTAPEGQPLDVAAAVVLAPTQWATWNDTTAAWTGGAVTQGTEDYGCWFYPPGGFAALAGYELASFEIEVSLVSGGPPEFFAHENVTADGGFTQYDTRRHTPMAVPVGVPTWVPLPLDWALAMIAGGVTGIGVGGGVYTGSYTGSVGRLRITPL